MHEMTLLTSVPDIVREEMDGHGLTRPTRVTLRCGACGQAFTPEEQAVFAACPACGNELGHAVLAGRGVWDGDARSGEAAA
jgi:Zn finger protein HypA/HybF involved in hydrogenase expression